jgi:hypothetical protein
VAPRKRQRTPDLLDALKDWVPYADKACRAQIASFIDKSGCQLEWAELLKTGCGPDILAGLLMRVKNADGRKGWKVLYGFSSKKKVKAALDSLRIAADLMDQMLDSEFGSGSSALECDHHVSSIPEHLRAYVQSTESLLPRITDRLHRPVHIAKELIVNYVLLATGEYHDDELSALLSSVLSQPYSSGAHAAWRNSRHLVGGL